MSDNIYKKWQRQLPVILIFATGREASKPYQHTNQNAFLALNTASHAYVLETGRITMEGKSEDLLADERVKAAYLCA